MNRREAGRLGGLATKEKYGLAIFRINGEKGGRPRLPTIDEVRQQSASSNENEKEARLPTSLRKLKMLYAQKREGEAPVSPGEVKVGD